MQKHSYFSPKKYKNSAKSYVAPGKDNESVTILYIFTMFCESISKGFKVTDPKSRVDARMVSIYKGAQLHINCTRSYVSCTLHIA